MPLPSILAEKLAKRGFCAPQVQRPIEKERKRDFRVVSGCPNKSNIYHECSFWCECYWSPVSLPDPKYMRNVGKLIQKYPLPHHWTEVFDKGVKRYYYWNMETDMVSWLPPKHPRAVISDSAARIRERRLRGVITEDRFTYKPEDEKEDKKRSTKSSRRDRDRDRERDRHRDRDRERDSDSSEKRHKHDGKEYKKKSRRNDVDPMDPAAYSDIPVGTWSDGLECNKSGADSTASGALYQQRPYPAPGDILANNKSKSGRP